MRALLLLALLVAPLAAAHPDAADHGVAQVAPHAGAPASRLIEGCRFVVRGEVQDGVDAADEGRVVVLASDGAGGLRVALEGEWQADANGTLRAGPLEAGPGVFLVGVELDERHGIYSEAFRVDCLEPVCPPEGCPTFRVSSTAQSAPPSALALLAALVGVALLGFVVAWRG